MLDTALFGNSQQSMRSVCPLFGEDLQPGNTACELWNTSVQTGSAEEPLSLARFLLSPGL